MCGLAGILDWRQPPDAATAERMTARMRHRGPDAGAVRALGPLVLGHRRLAIIDLSVEGNQPMQDGSGRYWIAFNGEIYNYRALADELRAAGAILHTRTDTEVILEAYKRWGRACVERLNGMFAFALWDSAEERLLLARDRMGEKPLYYAHLPGGGIVFASELKALRCHPQVSRRLDARALGQYLALNYVLSDACMLEGVHKLPAAHRIEVSRAGVGVAEPYWDLASAFADKATFRDEREAGDALTALIDDSVRLRLGADVPLGAFLSGGLDSASIVGAMNRVRGDEPVHTFTVGFGDRSYDEIDAARASARWLGAAHAERVIEVDMARALPTIAAAHDEPFADTSMLPTWFLTRAAREELTVCLSGDGGDELFAGYPTYSADRLRHLTAWMPAPLTGALRMLVDRYMPVSFAKVSFDYKLRQFLRGHAFAPMRAHYSWREIQGETQKTALLRPEIAGSVLASDPFETFAAHAHAVAGCHYLDQAMYVDMKTWLVDDILVKVDQSSMAHSLEVRTPFLDHRLVEFAARLPVELKMKGWRKKYLLRESQRPLLPPHAIDGAKRGFNAPVSQWINDSLGDIARDAIGSAAMRDWFVPATIDRLFAEHRAQRRDHGLAIFGLACLGIWMEASHA